MTRNTHPIPEKLPPLHFFERTGSDCPPHAWYQYSSDDTSVTYRCNKCGMFFRESKG